MTATIAQPKPQASTAADPERGWLALEGISWETFGEWVQTLRPKR